MNRVRNHAVIQNWREGVSARNHKNTLQSVACAGGVTELYSYQQKDRTSHRQWCVRRRGFHRTWRPVSLYDNFLSC